MGEMEEMISKKLQNQILKALAPLAQPKNISGVWTYSKSPYLVEFLVNSGQVDVLQEKSCGNCKGEYKLIQRFIFVEGFNIDISKLEKLVNKIINV